MNDPFPAEVLHTPNHLDEAVYTCYQAACGRNINLWEELKTIVFQSEATFLVVHLPGDRLVDTRALRRFAEVGRLCDTSTLGRFGLRKGQINPFNVFGLLHPIKATYLCDTVLRVPQVYTNDGTLTGTISFPPSLLVSLFRTTKVARVSCEWTKFNFRTSRRSFAMRQRVEKRVGRRR